MKLNIVIIVFMSFFVVGHNLSAKNINDYLNATNDTISSGVIEPMMPLMGAVGHIGTCASVISPIVSYLTPDDSQDAGLEAVLDESKEDREERILKKQEIKDGKNRWIASGTCTLLYGAFIAYAIKNGQNT